MRVHKILQICFTEEDWSWLLVLLEHLGQVCTSLELKDSIEQEFALTLLGAGKIQQNHRQEWFRQ